MESKDETDDENSSSSSTYPPPVSDLEEDVQNVVVKLEEVTQWEENHPQSPSASDGPSASNWEENPTTDGIISDLDAQNGVVIKMEEISDWGENNQEDYD